MDTDKDGTVSIQEIQTFMRGTGESAPKEDEDEDEDEDERDLE
jgi:hypothetical protein